uniref:Nicotinamide-nucleotide amidase n=1 Tax=Candidatus Kentrum sp. FM TaxID=2126340 RepID=A0A450VMS6_9GAMM|nr:MAG: nicotinamide-nucleotide amidase [Candidatus Kentron sp. FM]VFJ73172.1 MAG: nicotinamide-nucleotide amidase [Candidatus Kentron sp. FM]VFK06093.1 MAG: nicotinamide-nucleotide amidase [Candidatus Kentron sp. FM]
MIHMDTLRALVTHVGKRLAHRNLLLVTAESCTGGGIAEAVTAIAGSSGWFDRGFVTYSNRSKQEMLGVSSITLQVHGAVSEAVAREMATGALMHSIAHIGVAVSGIAGPGGGTATKPVGMVCFAWTMNTRAMQTGDRKDPAVEDGLCRSTTRYFMGDREDIRREAVVTALEGVIEILGSVDISPRNRPN